MISGLLSEITLNEIGYMDSYCIFLFKKNARQIIDNNNNNSTKINNNGYSVIELSFQDLQNLFISRLVIS